MQNESPVTVTFVESARTWEGTGYGFELRFLAVGGIYHIHVGSLRGYVGKYDLTQNCNENNKIIKFSKILLFLAK